MINLSFAIVFGIHSLHLLGPAWKRLGVSRCHILKINVWGLHHVRSHHFVLLVMQNVAVVQKPWELHQMFFRNIVIGILLNTWIVLSFGPSDTKYGYRHTSDESCVFPAFVMCGNITRVILADIFINLVEAAVHRITDIIDSLFSGSNYLLKNVESAESAYFSINFGNILQIKIG